MRLSDCDMERKFSDKTRSFCPFPFRCISYLNFWAHVFSIHLFVAIMIANVIAYMALTPWLKLGACGPLLVKQRRRSPPRDHVLRQLSLTVIRPIFFVRVFVCLENTDLLHVLSCMNKRISGDITVTLSPEIRVIFFWIFVYL
jgi:hypothetical protein